MEEEMLNALKIFIAQYEQEGTPDEARRYVNVAYLTARRVVRKAEKQKSA